MPKEEDPVKEILAELDKQTEPYAAWKGAKGTVEKGSKATVGTGKYIKERKGANVVGAVEEFAVDWYGGKKEDARSLAHMLRVDLGNHYLEFRQALKVGDELTAAKLVRDATEGKYFSANLEAITERLSVQTPDKRIAVGKELAKRVHGDDYVSAATNPQQLADVLGRQKQLAMAYKVA